MYENLVDKLVEIDKAAVATMSPEKQMKKFYKKVLNGKLKPSQEEGETDWYRFVILMDGTHIPVEYSHGDTIEDAGVDAFEASKIHVVCGGVVLGDLSLTARSDTKFTDKQISKLKQFFIGYNLKKVHVDAESGFSADVKSVDELDYLLTYGLDEAVATKVSPEKQLKYRYKDILNGKLIKNNCTWSNEQDWLKFWMFKDGSYIPVGDTHEDTLKVAEVSYHNLFHGCGAVAGSIQGAALQVDADRKFTEQQISRLKQFYIQYKFSLLYVDAPELGGFSAGVKSVEELDYLLRYGKDDMDEAVATEVSPEKKLRSYYKKVINGKLKGSTWTAEENWLKFIMFKNGDYIPVVHSHLDTINDADIALYSADKAGLAQGSIDQHKNSLNVRGESPLTSQQIARLRQFYIEYKITDLFVSFGGRGGIGTFHKGIKSSEDLSYALEYGEDDIDEAIEVPEYLYHGTFKPLLDRIKSEGLRIEGTVKNYSDSEEGLVYLAKTFEEAEAFAEVSEAVPDEWIDQIVVLKIDTDKLDKSKVANDPNVRDIEVRTFIYPQDIPPEALEVMMPSSGLDEAVGETAGYMGVREAGWIHPNGKREELEGYVMGDHDRDAFEKLIQSGVTAETAYSEYLRQGHIRYAQTDRGFNIELVEKPTDSQRRSIRKGIEEGTGEFYFSFKSSTTREYTDDGTSWKEFVVVLQKMP